jgi:NADPH:quinone reductase-like Zn-dependent oxidoreductase
MPIERRDEWLAAARGISHERWVSARRSLAPNGTLLSNGGGHAGGALGRVIRLTIVSMFVHQQGKPSPKFQNRADLEVLKGLVEAGKVTPVIDGTYPLRETP